MYSSPHLSVQYRPDLQVLVARWLDEPALPVVQAEYAVVLAAAQACGACRWLIDLRRRPSLNPALAAWKAEVWLPQVVAALAPARLRLAYLVAPDIESAATREPAMQPVLRTVYAAERPYDLRGFPDEGAAMRWLQA